MTRNRRRNLAGRRLLPNRLRRHPVASLLAVGVVLLITVERLGWVALPRPTGNDYERYDGVVALVTRVIDGDTLDIALPDADKSTTRVRLWGVDTPEVAGPFTEQMYFGPEASAFAHNMLQDREARIELSRIDTRDRYGRLLAYVYRADTGEMLNEALLRSGHAYADPRFDHEHKSEFARLEREARGNKVGLWAEVTPEQYPRWKRRDKAR
ncbi:MAG: thermonuclease family protein [Phycisphaerales bacterium]|nr:MAG: thermonuclease family protein [Phycisphaerales bacterium]